MLPDGAAQAVADPLPCLIEQLVFAVSVSLLDVRVSVTVLGKENVTVLVLNVAVTEAPDVAATVPLEPGLIDPRSRVVPAELVLTDAATVAFTVTDVCARIDAGTIATTTNAYFVSDLMLNIVNLLEAPASGSD